MTINPGDDFPSSTMKLPLSAETQPKQLLLLQNTIAADGKARLALHRSCVDHGDATQQQSTKLLEPAVSNSNCPGRLGGCSWPPHLPGDGPWGPPGRWVCGPSCRATLSGGVCIPAEHPRAAAIPEGDTWRKAPLDPEDWISVIAMSMEKALRGGRRARRSYYIFYIQLLPYGQVVSAPNLRSVNDSILYRTVTFDLHI